MESPSILSSSSNSPLDSIPLNGTFDTTSNDVEPAITKFVSDRGFYIVIMVVMVTLSGLIGIAGMAANVINMIVFIRQGVLSETSNVTLLGLAVADFLGTLTMVWTSIMFAMTMHKPSNINWDPDDIQYLTGAWPRVITGFITRAITTYISFERCFCVVFPFKVKLIFTPKTSLAVMIIIFAYTFISWLPVYYYNKFQNIPHPETNETLLTLVTGPGFGDFQLTLNFINMVFFSFSFVGIVFLCTVITISRVKMSSAWRQSTASGDKDSTSKGTKTQNSVSESDNGTSSNPSNKISTAKMRKEIKLIRMISLISVIFLISFIPNIAFNVLYGSNDEIHSKGLYKNLAWVVYSFIFLSETINSSINIVVYYRMSSRFKQEFNKLFGREDVE